MVGLVAAAGTWLPCARMAAAATRHAAAPRHRMRIWRGAGRAAARRPIEWCRPTMPAMSQQPSVGITMVMRRSRPGSPRRSAVTGTSMSGACPSMRWATMRKRPGPATNHGTCSTMLPLGWPAAMARSGVSTQRLPLPCQLPGRFPPGGAGRPDRRCGRRATTAPGTGRSPGCWHRSDTRPRQPRTSRGSREVHGGSRGAGSAVGQDAERRDGDHTCGAMREHGTELSRAGLRLPRGPSSSRSTRRDRERERERRPSRGASMRAVPSA